MTRTLAASVNSYLSEPVLDFRVLAEIQGLNSYYLLHTGVGTLTIGNSYYLGVGWLGGVEKIEESADNFTPAIRMWLTAVDSAPLTEVFSESLFGRTATLKRCWLRDGVVVNTPETWYVGQMGEVNVYRGDAERGNYIEINCETKLNRASKSSYYTREDMQTAGYSGDTFFDYTPQIPFVKALWGQRPVYFNLPGYPNWGDVLNVFKP